MTDLEETFGSEFAENVKKKTAERRQERNRVTEEQMVEICAMAVNEQRFKDGDPQFQYTTDNGVTHDVMLMQVPDPENQEVWEHLSEPWDGAARLPLEYLGQWYWSTFPQKELLRKVDQGEWVIIAGSVEENEGDNGETFYNIYPVRGMATLEEAKEHAQKAMDEDGFSTDEESDSPDDEAPDPGDFASDDDEEDQEKEEESGDDVFGGGDSDDDEEEEESSSGSKSGGLKALAGMGDEDDDEEEEEEHPVNYEEIAEFIENLSDKQDEDEEPQIMDLTEEHDQLDRLVEITCNQTDEDNEDGVRNVIIDVIDGHNNPSDEDDEEDEDEEELEGNLF